MNEQSLPEEVTYQVPHGTQLCSATFSNQNNRALSNEPLTVGHTCLDQTLLLAALEPSPTLAFLRLLLH